MAATSQLKDQFDAACKLLEHSTAKGNWLGINTVDLEKAVPSNTATSNAALWNVTSNTASLNTGLYKELLDFLWKDEAKQKGYIEQLRVSVPRCIDQISKLIAKARQIAADQPGFTKIEDCSQLHVPPDPDPEIVIEGLTTRPRAGVPKVSPLQRSLRNASDLRANIKQLLKRSSKDDGKDLDNVFVANVNLWVFAQFDGNKNISSLTEKWHVLVEEQKGILQDRFLLEKELQIRLSVCESFRKCGMHTWADLTPKKLREGKQKFDFKDVQYFANRENVTWKQSKEAWSDLKAFADSRPLEIKDGKLIFPPGQSDDQIGRWINALNAMSQAQHSGINGASRYVDRDATGFETRLIQEAHMINALLLKHDELNHKAKESESKIDTMGKLYWGLTSFRRDMNGVMWSLARLVGAITKLNVVLSQLELDLQTLQVHIWVGEEEAAAPFLASAKKSFDDIQAWLKATDVRRPDQPFHCANGTNDYEPSNSTVPNGNRPPNEKFIQAISGFALDTAKTSTGLRALTSPAKGGKPYLAATGEGKLSFSQTSWISFPPFPGYPKYEIGERKITASEILENGRNPFDEQWQTDFSLEPNEVGRAIWIKEFDCKVPGVLDVTLSIEDLNTEQNSMTLVLTQGKSCSLKSITIGWLLYTKSQDDSRRITSWQKDYTRNDFAYSIPATAEATFQNIPGALTAMWQVPDPQMGSRFYAKTDENMEWKMAPSVMIGFHRLKFGLEAPLHLRTGALLKDKKGLAVDVSTWDSRLFEVGLTVVAAE
ncbi:hypothetical protein SVAN01_03460 [Stagonosporopsis vannaccii]|nr:hypothetical protein SVAN01_03460 [Stagonosporopsis vannaccii]